MSENGAASVIRTRDLTLTKGQIFRYCHNNIIPSTMITACKPTVKQVRKTRLQYCVYAGLAGLELLIMLY